VRELQVLAISPSVDLGALALHYSKQIPPLVRYMLRGLGTKESETSDLMSYLLFVKDYARALLEIGYHDADRRIAEIKQFLGV
jgi:NTE family protein